MRVFILIVLCFHLLPAHLFAGVPGLVPLAADQAGGIVDLALVYQGGVHRPDWTQEDFAPIVSWTDPATGEEKWLFDGFLFLEIYDKRGSEFAHGYKQEPATRKVWEWYLDRLFEEGVSLHALDEITSTTAGRIGAPPRPRRVVLTLFEPISDQKNWGEIEGRTMDFSIEEDRTDAILWFLDQLEERWEKANFKNLELAGFYQLAERLRTSDAPMTNAVGDALRDRGYRFFWIPYWNATGAAQWKEFGFDVAYQQPNHFFSVQVPDSRLNEAIEFARENGMGMEFEWDARVLSKKEEYLPRMRAYLDAFENEGVWGNAAVAHYHSRPAYSIFNTDDPDVREVFNRYRRILAGRQREGQ